MYHRRSKVETVNFVEKTKMGEELTSKKWWMKKKEQRLKDIAYNIYRYMRVSGNALLSRRHIFCAFSYLTMYRRKSYGMISARLFLNRF